MLNGPTLVRAARFVQACYIAKRFCRRFNALEIETSNGF